MRRLPDKRRVLCIRITAILSGVTCLALGACQPSAGPAQHGISAEAAVDVRPPEPLSIAALAANCYTCHAVGSSASGMPVLSGLKAGEISAALYGYQQTTDGNTVMHRIARALSAQQIEGIATFVATYPQAGLDQIPAPVPAPSEAGQGTSP